MTIFDDNGGKIDLTLGGKDMFMPGSLLDETDASIANFCFVPILKHDFGPANTWFLGAPILDGYYTVFDMSQGSTLQVGISVKSDEFAFMDPIDDVEPAEHFLTEMQAIILAIAVMFVLTCLFVACKK
jgi:hypothetical protein